MKTVHFDGGCHINTAAKMLVEVCRTGETAQGVFNEIALTADETSTVVGIVADYDVKSERRAETYRNSPEGKKAAREDEERRRQMQRLHDTLMQQLPNLNFADDVAVLDWLCEFQDPSDYNHGREAEGCGHRHVCRQRLPSERQLRPGLPR